MTLIAQVDIDMQNYLLLHTHFPFTSETKEGPGPFTLMPRAI